MSNGNVAYSNELTIRFDQDSEGQVTWHLMPDEQVGRTVNISLEDMAQAGAPLCAMGIRAIYALFAEDFIEHALEKANIYLWKEYLKRQLREVAPGPDVESEARVIH